jgi:hypothetical protein
MTNPEQQNRSCVTDTTDKRGGAGVRAHNLLAMSKPTNEEVGRWAREAHLIIGEGEPDEGLLAFARAAYRAGFDRARESAAELLESSSDPAG